MDMTGKAVGIGTLTVTKAKPGCGSRFLEKYKFPEDWKCGQPLADHAEPWLCPDCWHLKQALEKDGKDGLSQNN